MFAAGKESNQMTLKLIDFLYNHKIKGLDENLPLYDAIKPIRKLNQEDFYEYIKKNVEKIRSPYSNEEIKSPFKILKNI